MIKKISTYLLTQSFSFVFILPFRFLSIPDFLALSRLSNCASSNKTFIDQKQKISCIFYHMMLLAATSISGACIKKFANVFYCFSVCCFFFVSEKIHFFLYMGQNFLIFSVLFTHSAKINFKTFH